MSKIIPWVLLIALATVLTVISFVAPHLLDDRNKFLSSFVNHELLATLGFIVAVTLASAANVHFELNRIEDQTNKKFTRTRKSLKRSANSLLLLFILAGFVVIIKPLLPNPPNYNVAIFNSIAICIVFFNLSVLFDLTRTVFLIPSVKEITQRDHNSSDT